MIPLCLSLDSWRHKSRVVVGTYSHTSPYNGCALEKFYRAGSRNVFGDKIKSERQFRELADRTGALPELVIEGNFIVEREAIRSLCREWGVNRITSEDGFFPHYSTIHADPVGFCWESSLPRMRFEHCAAHQRDGSRKLRAQWLQFQRRELPARVRRPFALWPLQLIGDRVNRWDMALEEWTGLLRHFRKCLPLEMQLVIKHHPRAKAQDYAGVESLARDLPNTVLIDAPADLKTLLHESSAVAGANSTVLSEARLMFLKPTYAYGRSWFTSHAELIIPISHRSSERLPGRWDRVEQPERMHDEWLMDYADWYLNQLLSRQLPHSTARSDWQALRRFVDRLSFHSYLRYGEEVFE